MCFCNLNSQALGSMLRKLKGQTVCGAQGVARSGCDGSGPQQKTNGQYVYIHIYICVHIYIYMCPSSTAPHLYLKTQRTSRVMRLPPFECTDAIMLGKVYEWVRQYGSEDAGRESMAGRVRVRMYPYWTC